MEQADGWGEHGYNHTGNGFACICDAREKGNLTEVDRWQDEDFDADIALPCRDRAYEEVWWCLKQFIIHYYTPLHRKLGILTRWRVKYSNQEIENSIQNIPWEAMLQL